MADTGAFSAADLAEFAGSRVEFSPVEPALIDKLAALAGSIAAFKTAEAESAFAELMVKALRAPMVVKLDG